MSFGAGTSNDTGGIGGRAEQSTGGPGVMCVSLDLEGHSEGQGPELLIVVSSTEE